MCVLNYRSVCLHKKAAHTHTHSHILLLKLLIHLPPPSLRAKVCVLTELGPSQGPVTEISPPPGGGWGRRGAERRLRGFACLCFLILEWKGVEEGRDVRLSGEDSSVYYPEPGLPRLPHYLILPHYQLMIIIIIIIIIISM